MHSIPNLPDPLARSIYADLCRSLPPPPEDTPEARHLRDERAMIAVAHLLPENAAEAEIAVLIVAAQFRAREALCAASQRVPGLDPGSIPRPDPGTSLHPDHVRRCTAQAACMMRQADSAIRVLLRLQAERVKAETAMRPAAMERAGYWFRSVSVPAPEPIAPEPPPPEPPTAQPASPQPAIAKPVNSDPLLKPRLEYGAMTPAERYATLYPDRATRILSEHGLPPRLTFPPPDPEVLDDLLSSSSPLVRALYQPLQAP
jgi:hypothetical protein